MRTHEILRVPARGFELRVVDIKWGGSITSGVPADIITSRHSALSGTAHLAPFKRLERAVDEETVSGLAAGDVVYLDAYIDDVLAASTMFYLTEVKLSYDSIEVSFSTDPLALSNTVRCAPLASLMPEGWDYSDTDRSRTWAVSSGLGKVFTLCSPLYPVFEAFRAGGFHMVPPVRHETIIDLPMQFSCITNAWSDRAGHTWSAYSYRQSTLAPSMVYRRGMCYLSDGRVWASTAHNYGFQVAEITGHFMVGVDATNNSGVTVIFGGGNWVSFTVYPDRGIHVSSSVGSGGSLPAGTMNGRQVVRFAVSRSRGAWWVSAGGQQVSGTFRPVASNNDAGHTHFTGIRADAEPGGRLAGVQVSNGYAGSPRGHYIQGEHRQTAFIFAPLTWDQNTFVRGVRDEMARDVLTEAAEALCASWWIDEHNFAQFRDMQSLLSGPTAKEFSFDRHVGAYNIEVADAGERDAIEVSYSSVAYSRNQRPRVVLFEGHGERLDAGDTAAYAVAPKNDEDWVGVDWRVRRYTAAANALQPAQEGSWIYDIDPNNNRANTKQYSYDVQQDKPWSAVISVNATGSIQLVGGSGLLESKLKFPLVRGRGRMEYTDASVRVGSSEARAPYLLDARKWVMSRVVAERLAKFLHDDLPPNKLALTGVEVPYTPSLRLGTIVVIRSGDASSRERRVLVLQVSHSPDDHKTVLAVLELSSHRTNALWVEAQGRALQAGYSSQYVNVESKRNNVDWRAVQSDSSNYPWGV